MNASETKAVTAIEEKKFGGYNVGIPVGKYRKTVRFISNPTDNEIHFQKATRIFNQIIQITAEFNAIEDESMSVCIGEIRVMPLAEGVYLQYRSSHDTNAFVEYFFKHYKPTVEGDELLSTTFSVIP